jgi:FtsP/CotA-like multicopper oxidase with cupredoxin domain
MNQRNATGVLLGVAWLAGILFLAPAIGGQAAQTESAVGKTRAYYVAADEVNWDYAPSGRDEAMGMPFDELERGYTESGPHHIGRVYKKAIYREYTDASFSTLKVRAPEEQYLGLLGPILRGEVGDTIKVVVKNNASHPYSMHPHGVLYQKDSEGADYNDGTPGADKADGAVPPGATHTYLWQMTSAQMVTADMVPDAPGTWLYHCHISDHMLAGMVGRYEVKPR